MQAILLQEGADLDALSSAYGLTLLNKRLKIALPNSVSSSVMKALNIFRDKFAGKTIARSQINLNRITKLYLTDSHNIPEGYTGKVIIFDHHLPYTDRENTKFYIQNTGAATTIVVEILKKRGKKLSSEDATILALGLYEDTGSFKFSSTTIRDIKAVEYLAGFNIDFEKLRLVLEDKFDSEDLNTMLNLSQNLSVVERGVGITHFNDRYSKDISRLIKYIKEFEELEAIFVVVGQKNKVSIIGRSKNQQINTADILSIFDGGGHWYASSAKLKGFSVREVVEILRFVISEKKLKVKDLLEKNIPIFYTDDPVSRYSQLPHFPVYIVVDRNNKYQGVITDKVLKELIKHGFGEEKLGSYLQDTLTLSPQDYIYKLLKVFKKTNQEIFPVVENGIFQGVITRELVLNTLFKKELAVEIKTKPKKKNINVLLNRFFPRGVLEELTGIGKLSQELGFRTFLVGGVVRDIIMGRQNLDIDLLVEGDATVLLSEYGRGRGYSYFYYPEFLTGYIKTADGLKIDFATARKEIYEYPGAYPKIEKASVEEDLLRRDFTVNSLIVEITAESFGVLFDYFGGLTDIREKRIRVLHPVSFIEDPIRILRALRFAGRFGFKLQRDTENLLKNAIKNDLLNYAPPGRVKLDLELTFNEDRVIEIIQLMEKYWVLRSVFEIERLTPVQMQKLQKVRDTITMLKEFFSANISRTFSYLMVLLSVKPLEEAYLLLKNFHFEREARYIETVFNYVSTLKEKDKIEDYLQLIKEPVDILLAVSVLSDDELSGKIVDIYKKSKNPLVSGNDLIKLGLKPSSQFKKILEDINIGYLTGRFKKKEDCIKYIKEKYLNQGEK